MKTIFPALVLITMLVLSNSATASTKGSSSNKKPLVIAIVDDAFHPNQEIFEGLKWVNAKEIPNNNIDDDENGFIDDIHGWDTSDQDGELQPPIARNKDFFHGTAMAHIIAAELEQYFANAAVPIKLMFVKSVSDSDENITLKDGYTGIQYALDNGADVINLSWSGGKFTSQARRVLSQAQKQGVIVVASVGNYPKEDPSYPAAHPAVIGVAGIKDTGLLYSSNYGDEVDLLALSTKVTATQLPSGDAYWESEGVSNATAIVSAKIAIVKHAFPDLTALELKHCLFKTAKPQDKVNLNMAGQLGAGRVSLAGALTCAESIGHETSQVKHQAKGSILYSRKMNRSSDSTSWVLNPTGEYAGITLKPFIEGKPKKVNA